MQGKYNLSQEGTCWVGTEAIVMGNARVKDDAMVYNGPKIYGSAVVCGESRVYDGCEIYGNAVVAGESRISGEVHIYENVLVSDTTVHGESWLHGCVRLYNASIRGNVDISYTKQVLVVNSLRYPLTIFPGYVCAGCRTFTHKAFEELTLSKCQCALWTKGELRVYKSFLKTWRAMQRVRVDSSLWEI